MYLWGQQQDRKYPPIDIVATNFGHAFTSVCQRGMVQRE